MSVAKEKGRIGLKTKSVIQILCLAVSAIFGTRATAPAPGAATVSSQAEHLGFASLPSETPQSVMSEDGRHLAQVGPRNGKVLVIVEGKEGPQYDLTLQPDFSLVYFAREDRGLYRVKL